MKLLDILNKVKGLFKKSKPEVAPAPAVVEEKPKKVAKTATKKVAKTK